MSTTNGATPAAPAAPATPPQPAVVPPAVPPNPSVVAPTQPEGKVTISTKEYAQLQRDAARVSSIQKRNAIIARKGGSSPSNDGSDPNAKVLEEANIRASEAERKALQLEVKGQVRDLLDSDKFKAIPKSTKSLILMNPAMLSEADNVEEAMLDIEDFLTDQVLALENGGSVVIPGMGGGAQPKGHDAPPATPAAASPAVAVTLEDTSKLKGPARSQAAIRNAIKTARGVKAA